MKIANSLSNIGGPRLRIVFPLQDVNSKLMNCFAMNRVYYAAFYAVSAALLERGASFKKHSGVRSAFHREFIKSGTLNTEWSKFYDRLFEDRQESDYIALTTFDHTYVENQINQCAEFHKHMRTLIHSITDSQ